MGRASLENRLAFAGLFNNYKKQAYCFIISKTYIGGNLVIEFNFDWGAVLTYLTVFVMACFGGIVDFLEKLHKAKVKPPMKTVLFNLLVKLTSSSFAGLIMFWFLQSRSENGVVILNGWSAISISISGYLGITALNIFVSIWRTAYDKRGAK